MTDNILLTPVAPGELGQARHLGNIHHSLLGTVGTLRSIGAMIKRGDDPELLAWWMEMLALDLHEKMLSLDDPDNRLVRIREQRRQHRAARPPKKGDKS